jgi:hypothetical protein
LHGVKNTANICDTFCRAQKKAKKIAVFFSERKNTAKISANICDTFCRAQNILQKLAQIFAIYFADCKN